MVLNNIENLLEKYDNAETTLQEEAQLSAYFNGNDVAPHLEHYRPMFVYFTNTQEERFTKEIPLKTKNKTNLYKWISIAAVAVLMLSIVVPKVIGPSEQEKQEALLAYNQTIEALNLISIGFNEGKEQLNPLTLVSQSIEKGRKSASRLNEFNKATNKIFKIK